MFTKYKEAWIVDPLLGKNETTVLPEYSDPATLASTINTFFIDKIDKIRTEFPLLEVDLPPFSFVDMDSIMPVCTASLDHFNIVTVEQLTKIISCMNKTYVLLVSLTAFQINFCFLIILQSSQLYCTL